MGSRMYRDMWRMIPTYCLAVPLALALIVVYLWAIYAINRSPGGKR